jgi:hypothetical protein
VMRPRQLSQQCGDNFGTPSNTAPMSALLTASGWRSMVANFSVTR